MIFTFSTAVVTIICSFVITVISNTMPRATKCHLDKDLEDFELVSVPLSFTKSSTMGRSCSVTYYPPNLPDEQEYVHALPVGLGYRMDLHLVLDLDNTLLDAKSEPQMFLRLRQPDTLIYPRQKKFGVWFRPHLHTFLNWAQLNCKSVSVYSAGDDDYVHAIVEALGVPFFLVHGRSSCVVEFDKETKECTNLEKSMVRLWTTSAARQHDMRQNNTLVLDDKPYIHDCPAVNVVPIREYNEPNVVSTAAPDSELLDSISRIYRSYAALQEVEVMKQKRQTRSSSRRKSCPNMQ